jgi:hypothetical protein
MYALSQTEVDNINDIIENSYHLFTKHNVYGGYEIGTGRSLWLHPREFNRDYIKYDIDVTAVINTVEKFRQANFPDAKIGRCYIHRLLPGDIVYRHRDLIDGIYFKITKRFQLFLNIPSGMYIESDPYPKENTIFLFNHKENHEYKNNGSDPLSFVVFDLCDPAWINTTWQDIEKHAPDLTKDIVK